MNASAPPLDRSLRLTLAWGVHALTASGGVVGAGALLAIAWNDLPLAAALMLIAFGIDSVDGTLARAVGVRDLLPHVDGRRLDDMTDYLNYVIVPSVFMVWAGSVVSWHFAALPIFASAYGFSNTDAKTEDDFFLGFPSYWNILAIYLWLFGISAGVGTALLAVLCALVFVPFKYLYPSKMPVLRRSTSIAGFVWCWALGACVLWPERVGSFPLKELTLVYPAWYFGLSFWLGGLHRRHAPPAP
jgi:phosphatidylcholine synthase